MGRYDSFSYQDAASLCERYNRATNPARYLSDHEHKRTRQQARAIINRLNKMRVPWVENDYNGKIRCGYYIIDGR